MAGRCGNGEGSVFKRADGRWCAQLSVGKDLNGKPRSIHRYRKTRREASEALHQMREEHRQGRLIVDAKTSLQEYLNNWLKVVQPSLSAKTFSDYERYVTQVIGPLLGKKVLSKLAPLDVQGLYQSFTT
jgi:hypothetical protein